MRPRYRRFVSDVVRRARAGARLDAEERARTRTRSSCARRSSPFVANEGDEPALVAEASVAREGVAEGPEAVDPLLAVRRPRRGRPARRHGALPRRSSPRREDVDGPARARARSSARSGCSGDPSVVPAALNLTLSADFDARESIVILREEAASRETRGRGVDVPQGELRPARRAAAARIAGAVSRRSPRASATPEHRADVEAFFKDRAPKYMGGPRYLAQSLEQIQLRTAFKAAQQESVNDFLRRYEPRPTIDLKPQTGI